MLLFLLLSQLLKPLLGCTRSRGRCWAAIRLSHRPEPSGHAVHGEFDGLDIGGQHGRRFVLLHHTHRPQRRPYSICTSRSGNVLTPVRRRLSETQALLGRVIPGGGCWCRGWRCGVLCGCPSSLHSIGDLQTVPHVYCCCMMNLLWRLCSTTCSLRKYRLRWGGNKSLSCRFCFVSAIERQKECNTCETSLKKQTSKVFISINALRGNYVQEQEIHWLATCRGTIKSAKWKGTFRTTKQEVTIKIKETKDGENSAKHCHALKWGKLWDEA